MSPRDDWRAPTIVAARKAFRFLDARGAKVKLEDHSTDTTVVYLLATASFKDELDWREQATFVLVCRGTDFQRTPGYCMHEGQRARVHLDDALGRAGLVDPEVRGRLRTALRASGVEAMRGQLQLYASALEPVIDQLTERYERVWA